MGDSPLTRLMFENVMSELGYNNVKIVLGTKLTHQSMIVVEGHPFYFTAYMTPYPNKISYVYHRHLDAQQKFPTYSLWQLTKNLADNILIDSPGRVAEVGWEVKYSIAPSALDVKSRSKMMIGYFKHLKEFINKGCFGYTPNPGDILTSYPYGPRIGAVPSVESWQIGKEERASLAKKLGFGDVKSDGWNYGQYDSETKLQPI
jgi:hypothetical protein